MRAWDTYSGVENTVKNMLTSLRAVSELQNPAIRERHWQQLMAATKVCSEILTSNLEKSSLIPHADKDKKKDSAPNDYLYFITVIQSGFPWFCNLQLA